VLRAGLLAFLGFLADEPTFARVLYVDLPTADPMAAERLAPGLRDPGPAQATSWSGACPLRAQSDGEPG
jgi:hypothetical protein